MLFYTSSTKRLPVHHPCPVNLYRKRLFIKYRLQAPAPSSEWWARAVLGKRSAGAEESLRWWPPVSERFCVTLVLSGNSDWRSLLFLTYAFLFCLSLWSEHVSSYKAVSLFLQRKCSPAFPYSQPSLETTAVDLLFQTQSMHFMGEETEASWTNQLTGFRGRVWLGSCVQTPCSLLEVLILSLRGLVSH